MSGDWLKWEKGLPRKMRILQIAARLHMRPTDAAGTLMLLMEWLDDNVSEFDEHGNAHVTLGALQSSALDAMLGVTGYMEAMAEVGWTRLENDDLVFVNVGQHNGQTAKKRANTSSRVAALRQKRRCNAESVISSLSPSRSSSGKGVQGKTPIQLRVESWFHRKPITSWDSGELRAWSKNRSVIEATAPEDIDLLEKFYAKPQQETFSRKDLCALLNHWNGELDKARNHHNGNDKGRTNSRAYSQADDYSKFSGTKVASNA